MYGLYTQAGASHALLFVAGLCSILLFVYKNDYMWFLPKLKDANFKGCVIVSPSSKNVIQSICSNKSVEYTIVPYDVHGVSPLAFKLHAVALTKLSTYGIGSQYWGLLISTRSEHKITSLQTWSNFLDRFGVKAPLCLTMLVCMPHTVLSLCLCLYTCTWSQWQL